MRDTCLDCALKHIAQAEVLMEEAFLGYPLHSYYAIGHLAEAEAELLAEHAPLADSVRILRKAYEHDFSYPVPTAAIMESIIVMKDEPLTNEPRTERINKWIG